MKLTKAIKTATLISILAIGVQGTAFANDKRLDQPAGNGGGPHVKVFNGTNGAATTPSRDPSSRAATQPRPATPGSVTNGQGNSQVLIGLLLPAIQK